MTHRMFSMAARGLMLATVTTTALLILMSPSSLSARATDAVGATADWLAIAALVAASIGWADVVWHDAMGRLILPGISTQTRHSFCVTLYSFLAGWYGVLAFTSMDPSVQSSWVLIADYVAVAAFGSVLAVGLATEERGV